MPQQSEQDVEQTLRRICQRLEDSAERRSQLQVSKSGRTTRRSLHRHPGEGEYIRKLLKLQTKAERSCERREQLRTARSIGRTTSSRTVRQTKLCQATNDQKIQQVRSQAKTRRAVAIQKLAEKHSARAKEVECNLRRHQQVAQLEKYSILRTAAVRERRLREKKEAEARERYALQEYETELRRSSTK